MPTLSISRAISHHAQVKPNDPALTSGEESYTWAELDRATNRLARSYQAHGVGQGDLVTLALRNGAEFTLAAVAIWKLGATPLPVSPKLPRRELREIIELADPSLVIGLGVDENPFVPAGYTPHPALHDGQLPDLVSPRFKAPTSGGSTGRPKIILSSTPGEFDIEGSPFATPHNSIALVPGALYHNAPFTLSCFCLVQGNHVITMPRFDEEAMLALVAQHRPTYLYVVPTMMQRVMRLAPEVRDGYDLSSLEVVIHTGAPCPAWLKREWIDLVGPETMVEVYGGTEQQSLTLITGTEWLEKPGSVGL